MSTETNKEIQIRMLAHAWSDAAYKNQLVSNPADLCRREGMKFDGEMRISDKEAAPNIFFLPPAPATKGGVAIDYTKQASDLIANDNEMF